MANLDNVLYAFAHSFEAKLQQKREGDCNFLALIHDYLKPDVQERANFTNLRDFTINDFALDKIKEFETVYFNHMRDVIKRDSLARTTEYLAKQFPTHKIENLKADKTMALDNYCVEYGERVAHTRLKAFKSGKCFREIFLLNPSAKPPVPIVETDFTDSIVSVGSKRNKGTSTLSSLNQNHQRQESARVSLMNSYNDRQRLNRVESFHSLLSGLDVTLRQRAQIKHIKELANKLPQSIINGVTKAQLTAHSEISSALLCEAQTLQEAKAQRAYHELILQEESQQNTIKEKKRKNKNKSRGKSVPSAPTSQLKEKITISNDNNRVPQIQNIEVEDDWQQRIILLNNPRFSASYRCHSRLERWVKPNLKDEDIRGFEDFDFTTQQWVKKYEHCDSQALINHKNNHSLVGIERLCSDTEILERYTFGYSFVDHNGQEKFGRGFYAIKTFEAKKEHGIIYVGIGEDKVIYHAMFESLEDKEICPESLIKALDSPREVENSKEEWFTTTQCAYSLDVDHVISMEIKTGKKQGLTFQLYPL